MGVKIILKSGLVERRDLRSGRIYREGSLPEYGVIFTSNKDKSEDDLGLDTNLISNAFIGNTDDPVEDKNLFFEILGGYFYHDNYPEPGITTNVFGIALESQFGIEEGGVTTLDDNWKLDDPQKPILDESYWTKQFGKHHGWTFIVTLKEREKFPTSDEELKIVAYCPEIKEIQFEIGNCEYDPQLNQLKRKIIFKTLIGDEEPRKWSWQFGDGGSDSGTGKPPESIVHLYEKKPGSVPKLCLIGHQACDEICQEIELTGFETCPECPRIMHIEHISKQKDENITTVDFSVEYSGNKPEKFTWDWGDGSPEETTTESTISHDYEMLKSGPAKYTLTLTASGPNECQDSGQIIVEIPQKVVCPQIKEVKVIFGECKTEEQKRIRKVSFVPWIVGETPDQWILDFGDGSTESDVGAPSSPIDHFYEKKPSVAPNLTLIGPNPCKESKREIDLTGFEECRPCPQIISVAYAVKDKDENYKTVEFTVAVNGIKPDKFEWDWGDGSQAETTTELTGLHDYLMLETGPQKYTVSVASFGPDDCQDSDRITIEVPRKIIHPEIKEIKVTYGACKTVGEIRLRSVSFAPVIEGDDPDNWIWYFGDGESESGAGQPPEPIEHFYEKKPPIMPKLCLSGPAPFKEICKETDLAEFKECLACPKIKSISHILKVKDINTMTVEFTVVVSNRTPEKFEWDWGDGSPIETTAEATASHDYEMSERGPKTYKIIVNTTGPEDCQDSEHIEVEIPQKVICPEIREIKMTYGNCKTENEKRLRRVTFAPIVEGDRPDNWMWDFGDGASETGEGSPPDTIEHFYEKKPQHTPKLCLSGPKLCKETCKEVDFSKFEECPSCPHITGCKTAMRDKDENTKLVELTVELEQGKPNKFEWDWGDGSAKETTTDSKALHEYRIPATGIERYNVTVTSFGPEDCQDSEITAITIPVRKVPKSCFFMPLLVAFLLAAIFATLITYNVAKIYHKLQNHELLVPVIIILAMLTLFAIILWYHIRKRKSCPGSISCEWLGIGWVVFSVGMLISLYLKSYSAASWWTVIAIFFIFAVILLILWLRKCAVSVLKVVAHLIDCLLAVAFVIYLLLLFRIVI